MSYSYLPQLMSFVRHNKCEEMCEVLDNDRVFIDAQDEQGNTLLMVAAQNNNRKIVKALLRRGASANIKNLNGDTALHHAFGLSYMDLGNYLIQKAAADDTALNSSGLTPYEVQLER